MALAHLALRTQRHVALLPRVTVDPYQLEQQLTDARLVDPCFQSFLRGAQVAERRMNVDDEAVPGGRPFCTDRDTQLVAIAGSKRIGDATPIDTQRFRLFRSEHGDRGAYGRDVKRRAILDEG